MIKSYRNRKVTIINIFKILKNYKLSFWLWVEGCGIYPYLASTYRVRTLTGFYMQSKPANLNPPLEYNHHIEA